jgi:hypothetical protein
VPSLILGMDGAEPPTAATAVESCGRITGFVHERNGLTRPFEVPGFCLIRLLQHVPSSRGQYTPARLRGVPEGESDLDVQWAGTVLPGATIKFVTSESTETTAGTVLSGLYIVENNLAGAMSEGEQLIPSNGV